MILNQGGINKQLKLQISALVEQLVQERHLVFAERNNTCITQHFYLVYVQFGFTFKLNSSREKTVLVLELVLSVSNYYDMV